MTIAAGAAGLSDLGVLETSVRGGSVLAAVVGIVAALVEEGEEEQHHGSVSTAVSAWERELEPERESELGPGSWPLRYACSGLPGD